MMGTVRRVEGGRGLGCEEDGEVGSVRYRKMYKGDFVLLFKDLAGVLWQDFASRVDDSV